MRTHERIIRGFRFVWWRDVSFGWPRLLREFYGSEYAHPHARIFVCWHLWIETHFPDDPGE